MLGSSCSGYVAVDTSNNAIIVAFRGSEAITQYIGQIASAVQPYDNFAAGGKVLSYYNTAFGVMWESGMGSDVTKLKLANPGYQLWVSLYFVRSNYSLEGRSKLNASFGLRWF